MTTPRTTPRKILDSLCRDDVLRALERIRRDGIPRQRGSKTYCLVYEGRHYPPKYVLCKAGKLEFDAFSGGLAACGVLALLCFQVTQCSSSCGGTMTESIGCPVPAAT